MLLRFSPGALEKDLSREVESLKRRFAEEPLDEGTRQLMNLAGALLLKDDVGAIKVLLDGFRLNQFLATHLVHLLTLSVRFRELLAPDENEKDGTIFERTLVTRHLPMLLRKNFTLEVIFPYLRSVQTHIIKMQLKNIFSKVAL